MKQHKKELIKKLIETLVYKHCWSYNKIAKELKINVHTVYAIRDRLSCSDITYEKIKRFELKNKMLFKIEKDDKKTKKFINFSIRLLPETKNRIIEFRKKMYPEDRRLFTDNAINKAIDEYIQDKENKLEYIFCTFGFENQLNKLAEEITELREAINSKELSGIIEEIADVLVLIDQFKQVIPEINEVYKKKLNRTINRLKVGYYAGEKEVKNGL